MLNAPKSVALDLSALVDPKPLNTDIDIPQPYDTP